MNVMDNYLMRIEKCRVILFTRQENYILIRTTIGKKEKIKTFWCAYNRKRVLEKSDAWRKVARSILYGLKINGCAICGYNKCENALDFHHVNSEEKKFQINSITMSFSNKRIMEELNKCILLCANCHREIHKEK